jgi:hypothetical protein
MIPDRARKVKVSQCLIENLPQISGLFCKFDFTEARIWLKMSEKKALTKEIGEGYRQTGLRPIPPRGPDRFS